MRPQYANRLISSFNLWFNNTLLREGQAYQTTTSIFYPIGQVYYGLYTYATPYNQFVSDYSVTGATIITGVYLNGTFVSTGVSGLKAIDYENGRVHFTGQLPSTIRVSGTFSFKEFNVQITEEQEEKLLFETKYSPRPKLGQAPTGLWASTWTYPIIFLKNVASDNKPFAFGGQDDSIYQISAMILADSQFNLDALSSLFVDKTRTILGMLNENEYPYNVYGSFKTGLYNYTGLVANKDYSFINDIHISKFQPSIYSQMKLVNPGIHFGVIDFEISKVRYPRLGT